jgi:HlyD family secretion protein
MQVIANIDQADIGLVENAKSVKFSVDAFPGKDFDGQIQQMRLNPQNVQNVVTYNVVIDVANPDQKLKPGMTANLTITIDERNNVLKVPNAALRFTPQDVAGRRSAGAGQGTGAGNGSGQGRRQQTGSADGSQTPNPNGQGNGERQFAPASAPVLPGQMRRIWVMGANGKPQSKRVTVGLTDGAFTEIAEGSVLEGEVVITGQTITSANKAQSSQTPAPGFGGAQRTGAPGGGRR